MLDDTVGSVFIPLIPKVSHDSLLPSDDLFKVNGVIDRCEQSN
jgi:hypothetical protein